MKLDALYRGQPGHPVHPPLAGVTIGVYTFATIAAVLDVLDIAENAAAPGWALALVVGLVVTIPTALAGLADWLRIESGTPLKRTATFHLIAMVVATALFALTALFGYSDGIDGRVETGPFLLTVAGYLTLALGGWLGGAIVFVHGMRVLNLVEEPASRAVSPVPNPEKEAAEE